MFGMEMMGNYDSRKVDRYEKDGLIVSTSKVTDSDSPYETAIHHKRYNSGEWVIVQMYENIEDAKVGHKEWVKKMTSKNLPDEIKDVSTSTFAKLCDVVDGDETWRNRKAEN